MQSETLRLMIREVLAEELQRVRGQRKMANAPIREETVSLLSDADLGNFVQRLLRMTADPATRSALETGRLRFKLDEQTGHQRPEIKQVTLSPRGFVSEKQIDQLPEGTTVLTVGKSVRFTPLAKDRLRAKNITIERIGQ